MYSDHPYITLNGLPAAKKEVATDFRHFLTTKTALEEFAELGFRDGSGAPTTDNGTQPGQLPKPLGQPSGKVLYRTLEVWRELRKHANVLLVIDTSGSMDFNDQDEERVRNESSKLDRVKEAHGALLDGFTKTDKVGLWHFSDDPVVDQDPAPMGSRTTGGKTQRQLLEDRIAALRPDAGTALYRTIDDAVQHVRDHYDDNAINAVVILSDGRNNAYGGPGLEELTRIIGDPDQPAVRVFTIAYGHEADRDTLRTIAEASKARAYDAAYPDTINEVLTNVISNF